MRICRGTAPGGSKEGFALNIIDIHFASYYLESRKDAKSKKYSQEYIDRYSFSTLENIFLSSPDISEEAKGKAREVYAGLSPAGFGTAAADDALTDLCTFIIQHSSETDLTTLLERNPRKITDWRKMWNKIRGTKPKRRRLKGITHGTKEEK